MAITGTAQFNAVIGIALSKAIAEVIDKAYEELKRIIESNVYGAGTGMGSHTIPDAWRHETFGLAGELSFEPAWLMLAPSRWIHGSAYDDNWRDVRDVILNIIEGGYNAYNARATNAPIPARPFWDEFLASVDAQLDGWVRSALAAQGLMVV